MKIKFHNGLNLNRVTVGQHQVQLPMRRVSETLNEKYLICDVFRDAGHVDNVLVYVYGTAVWRANVCTGAAGRFGERQADTRTSTTTIKATRVSEREIRHQSVCVFVFLCDLRSKVIRSAEKESTYRHWMQTHEGLSLPGLATAIGWCTAGRTTASENARWRDLALCACFLREFAPMPPVGSVHTNIHTQWEMAG